MLLLAPGLAAILVLFIVPIIAAFLLSLTDFDIYSLGDAENTRVIGLKNYANLLRDPLFWKAMRNTALFLFVGGPLTMGVGLVAALLVNSKLARAKGVFRTIFFAPYVTTLVAVAVVFRYLYHPRFGLSTGASRCSASRRSTGWAIPAGRCRRSSCWPSGRTSATRRCSSSPASRASRSLSTRPRAWTGPAAGSSSARITLPLLSPTLLFLGVITTIGYFQFFAEPYVMTDGGKPLNATLSVGLLMYKERFPLVEHGLRRRGGVRALPRGPRPDVDPAQASGTAGRMKKILLHAALGLIAVVSLIPLVWMVSASLMPSGEASEFPPPFFPSKPTFVHYGELFSRLSLGRAALNSFVVAVLGTAGVLLLNSMAGYAFAKLRFRGRDRLFRALLAALVIPAPVAILPLFLMLRSVGLVNTYVGAAAPTLAGIIGIFLVRQFARAIPDDLLNAARLEGASEFRIYRTIVLPLLSPVLARSGSSPSWRPGTTSSGPSSS